MFYFNDGCLIVSCIDITAKWCVCYHRYLRFFPDGHVIMLTTPDDPLVIVPRLRTKNSRYNFSQIRLFQLEK